MNQSGQVDGTVFNKMKEILFVLFGQIKM